MAVRDEVNRLKSAVVKTDDETVLLRDEVNSLKSTVKGLEEEIALLRTDGKLNYSLFMNSPHKENLTIIFL